MLMIIMGSAKSAQEGGGYSVGNPSLEAMVRVGGSP